MNNSLNLASAPPQITPLVHDTKHRNGVTSSDSIGIPPDRNVAGTSRPLPRPPVVADDDEPSAIPGLIQRLNRAMAKLPPGGVPPEGEAELPPEYRN